MLEHRGWLADARVLDLFAGSGALGIEALSRGARSAIFVDDAPQAVRALRENIAASGVGDHARVLPTTVATALRTLAREGVQVDGVFADPPYARRMTQQVVDAVVAAGVLAAEGWIAVEHRADETPVAPAGLAIVVSRRHGQTTLTLLRREEVAT
jgi:16S rRNA (guanine(966)-N(2))-methyltransferase RsmD